MAEGNARPVTAFDEAFGAGGMARAHYAGVLEEVERRGAATLAREVAGRARAAGLEVNGRPLAVDPVPRLLTADEWRTLSEALARRARTLETLVAGVYAGDDGVLDPGIARTSPYFEPDLVGVPAAGPAVGIVGFDVIRVPDGGFCVLEDNLLTPGHTALPAARELAVLAPPPGAPPADVHGPTRAALRAMLGPSAAILGDAPLRWELRWLAAFLEVPALTPHELRADERGVRLRDGGRPLEVLWQRTAEDRLRSGDGAPTVLGELLLAPLRAGTVRLVTRAGAGVAHDKRALPAVAAAVGPTPVPGVRTLVLSRAADRAELLEDLPGHVVKPATGAGGRGVHFGAALDRRELEARLDAEPHAWIAQPLLDLSVHPTVTGDRLEPRAVDLRAFAVRGPDGWTVLPGGVSRFATDPRSGVVNTSAGGGIKDVWVLQG